MNERENNTISSCVRQSLTGIPFLLAWAGILLALLLGGFFAVWSAIEDYKKGLLPYGIHVEIMQKALHSDAMCLLMPVFSALPFAASFFQDMESGFLKSYLPRAGRGHYVTGKLLAVSISGGTAAMSAILVYYGSLILLFLPMERCPALEDAALSFGTDVGRTCVLFFCAGMLFSLVGMLFSILTSSRYMAYAAPFVWEYVLIILRERYLKNFYILDPREWMNPTKEYWVMGELGACIYMLVLSLLFIVLTAILMVRRLDEI